jgi:hypothetical protein
MELTSQAMPDIFADHRKSAPMSFGDDGVANQRDAATGVQCVNCQVQTIESALGHGPPFLTDFANEKGFTLIAMPTIDHGGNIDVDDVSIDQLAIAWDPMANHFIDAGTTAFGKILISQGGGLVAVITCPTDDQVIDFGGGDPGFDMRTEKIHQLRIDSTGAAHRILLIGGQN